MFLKAKILLTVSLIASFLSASISAQIIELADTSSFSEKAFKLDLSLGNGASLEGRFDAVGVVFHGQGPGSPQTTTLSGGGPFFGSPALVNTPPEGRTSSNLALVIQFRQPIKRIGMNLSNGSEATTAELRADSLKERWASRLLRSGWKQPSP